MSYYQHPNRSLLSAIPCLLCYAHSSKEVLRARLAKCPYRLSAGVSSWLVLTANSSCSQEIFIEALSSACFVDAIKQILIPSWRCLMTLWQWLGCSLLQGQVGSTGRLRWKLNLLCEVRIWVSHAGLYTVGSLGYRRAPKSAKQSKTTCPPCLDPSIYQRRVYFCHFSFTSDYSLPVWENEW